MIGNIILPYKAPVPPPDPDDYFDPTTHIATEADFIRFLEAGIYTSDVIGYKVQLSNTVDYNNGIWVIADVNHDSENTGQTDCYDLIAQDVTRINSFGSSSNYRQSVNIRTFLNSTFYSGFNSIKDRMLLLKYNSNGNWYNDDYIVIPSIVETNLMSTFGSEIGLGYPIFTDGTSRIKIFSSSGACHWWTRTATGDGYYLYGVSGVNGSLFTPRCNDSQGFVPIMRVH